MRWCVVCVRCLFEVSVFLFRLMLFLCLFHCVLLFFVFLRLLVVYVSGSACCCLFFLVCIVCVFSLFLFMFVRLSVAFCVIV